MTTRVWPPERYMACVGRFRAANDTAGTSRGSQHRIKEECVFECHSSRYARGN